MNITQINQEIMTGNWTNDQLNSVAEAIKYARSRLVRVVANQITKGTKERAEHAKAFIESKYSKLKNDEKERKEAWDMLENKMVRLNLSE